MTTHQHRSNTAGVSLPMNSAANITDLQTRLRESLIEKLNKKGASELDHIKGISITIETAEEITKVLEDHIEQCYQVIDIITKGNIEDLISEIIVEKKLSIDEILLPLLIEDKGQVPSIMDRIIEKPELIKFSKKTIDKLNNKFKTGLDCIDQDIIEDLLLDGWGIDGNFDMKYQTSRAIAQKYNISETEVSRRKRRVRSCYAWYNSGLKLGIVRYKYKTNNRITA
ncbi:MAG: hypothetical protein GT601_18210 [Acidaminobacter sp.]|uniref:hypothetical protein n=1 Tax=Acidaminobacter sp. TaxID=1872102 RepID=UPI0013854BAE|nr:hypothetical protein [Acidaminobacter sp.]MZQ99606.1 hypothetical protein [Acidaminobacter sp.]